MPSRHVQIVLLSCFGAAACATRATAPAALPDPAAASDPLAAVMWMEGRWQAGSGKGGAAEHWTRIGDRLIGIGFTASPGHTSVFEVLVIRRKTGALIYTAIPAGRRMVDFPLLEHGDRSVTFANPKHDFPRTLHYDRKGEMLFARAAAPGASARSYSWHLTPPARAALLESADRAFAGDVRIRGLDAWVERFDRAGTQWSDAPIIGVDRIRHLMTPLFARPDYQLTWSPVTSGMSPAGDLGYTLGLARATWTGDNDAPSTTRCGTYITIWRRRPDGAWRALFDARWENPCPAR